MTDFNGVERRTAKDNSLCQAHDAIMQNLKDGSDRMLLIQQGQARMEEALRSIMERQIAYMKDQSDTSHNVQDMKGKLENGISNHIANIAQCVEDLKLKVTTIERFSWFGEWINQMKDNLFKNSLKVAFGSGLIIALLYFIVRTIK